MVLAAVLGIAINQIAFLFGLERTTASHSVVIASSIPVLTLCYAFLFGVERPPVLKWLGFVLSLLGIGYLIGPEALSFGGGTFVGDLLTLASANSYALYLVVARPLSSKYSSFWITGVLFVFGLLAIVPLGFSSVLAERWGEIPWTAWASLAYAVGAITIGTYGLGTWLLRHAEASRVAQNVYLQPLIGMSMASFYLGEAVSPRLVVAAALVLGGVALTQTGRMNSAVRKFRARA